MSSNRWTDKDVTCKAIPFRLKRERSSAKWDNTGEPWGHYAQWISQSEKNMVPLIWGIWNEKVKILWYQRVEHWLPETGNRGEREVTDGQAGSFSQVRRTSSRVCCITLNQQSWIITIWCHLQDTWRIVTPMNLFTKQNHRHREQICGCPGSRGGTN